MKHYVGLDVSVKETSVCIVDETGKICRELKAPSHPKDLLQILQDPAWRLEWIGLEAGPLSQWLSDGLARAGLPVVCTGTRHTKAFLKAQVNRTDKNDAGHRPDDAGQPVVTGSRQDAGEPEAPCTADRS